MQSALSLAARLFRDISASRAAGTIAVSRRSPILCDQRTRPTVPKRPKIITFVFAMLKSVEFMSLKSMKSLQPNESVAVISIHDSSTLRDLPSFAGFLDVLRLNMLDVCEEHMGQAPGTWTDEPSAEQHSEYCGIAENYAPALSHASAIRSFVDNIHARADEIALVVHCSFGVSRSAAVAGWASERFGVKLHDRAGVGLKDANPRITRLLRSVS